MHIKELTKKEKLAIKEAIRFAEEHVMQLPYGADIGACEEIVADAKRALRRLGIRTWLETGIP